MNDEVKLNEPVENPKRARIKHPDRVNLEPVLLERIDGWITQVMAIKKGVNLTRKDLVTWLIQNQPEVLPTRVANKLAEQFFDEERYLSNALKEIREARARGEVKTLEDIRKRDEGIKPPIQLRTRGKSKKSAKEDPASENCVPNSL